MSNVVTVFIGASLFALLSSGCSASGSASQAMGGGTGNGAGGSESNGGSASNGGDAQGTGGAAVSVACNGNVQTSGCTPGQMTQTGTLNGRYENFNASVGGKGYFIQVNEWGSTATQQLTYGGSSFFTMTQQAASLGVSGAPAGYPSIFIGANSNHVTSGSGLPKQVSSLGTVLTTWNWSDNGTMSDSANNVYNAAYDVWFSTNAGGDPAAGTPSGGFLMVWYYAQGCQPIGTLKDAGRTIDGIPGCWDVWTGTNSGKPVISYKRQGVLQSFGYDLNLFIKDALANYPSNMQSNWYLTNIFTGFEIWKGGVGLQSTSFCAEVN